MHALPPHTHTHTRWHTDICSTLGAEPSLTMSPCCRSLRWRAWPSPPSAECLWDDDGCVSAAATGDKIKFERRKLKKEVDGRGVKVRHNIQWQSKLCPCCHTSSALIWWLPPLGVPLRPVFSVSSRSAAPLSLSVFTRFPSFSPLLLLLLLPRAPPHLSTLDVWSAEQHLGTSI